MHLSRFPRVRLCHAPTPLEPMPRLSEALGGRTIKWDPKREKVIGDSEAEKLLKKVDFRKPWTL